MLDPSEMMKACMHPCAALTSLSLLQDANLWDVTLAPTIVMTQRGVRRAFQEQLRSQGVEVVQFDFLTPDAVAQYCAARGFLQCLWECGGTLAAPAIASQTVHKAMAFIAPKLVRLDYLYKRASASQEGRSQCCSIWHEHGRISFNVEQQAWLLEWSILLLAMVLISLDRALGGAVGQKMSLNSSRPRGKCNRRHLSMSWMPDTRLSADWWCACSITCG